MAHTLQIRHVPEELHAAIVLHAREQGTTISQYLLRRLAQIEGKPEIADVLDAHWHKTKGHHHARPGIAGALLQEDRDR